MTSRNYRELLRVKNILQQIARKKKEKERKKETGLSLRVSIVNILYQQSEGNMTKNREVKSSIRPPDENIACQIPGLQPSET